MKMVSICTLFAVGLVFIQACSGERDGQLSAASSDEEHSEIVKKDLLAIISLQGAPCGQVISYDVQEKLDYVATCKTGDRYRVHVSAEGRVHVNTHGDEG